MCHSVKSERVPCAQVDVHASRLKELETRLSHMDGGLTLANSATMEAALRAAEQLVDDLQDDTEELTGESQSFQMQHLVDTGRTTAAHVFTGIL